MNLQATYYLAIIKGIKRGSHNGRFLNAKPLYLYALMRGIEEGVLIGNVLRFDKTLEDLYRNVCVQLEPNNPITPFFKPYYYSSSEGFYNIKWKDNIVISSKNTPSAKFIRENIEYAYLDDQLWDLLQDPEIRKEYKQTLIDRFIRTTN